ncbi:MAG: hypothetical protein TECD_00100 [Hyphomicrobiaceae bacterium hypho_1]
MFYLTIKRLYNLDLRCLKDTRGSVAIEFSAIIIPFLALIFGLIATCLYFFTTFSLEYAVKESARIVRTGQFNDDGMSKEQFINDVCQKAVALYDCQERIRVDILEFDDFRNIEVPSCLDENGALTISSLNADEVPGSSGKIIYIQACYEWTLPKIIPLFDFGNMNNGSALIQASTIFETEPF